MVLLSPEQKWDPVQLELCNQEAPALCFLPDGNLIIASGSEAKVMSVEGRIQTLATLRYSAPSAEPPIGVVSLGVSTCAILLPGARVEVFRIEN